LNHHTTPRFWACYRELPVEVQSLADKCFELAKEDPKHPSIHLKKVGRFWSDGLVWFWIGPHPEYERLVG
jgi:hypothetical protein